MEIPGRSVVVTGAGNGIGAALALRLAAERPRVVVVSDRDADAAGAVAGRVRDLGVAAVAVRTDVSDPEQVRDLVALVERDHGGADLICSNAGVATGMGVHASPAQWADSWSVNVMAHVHLAQAALPGMSRRRGGHLLITASGVGLLGLPGDAPYTVTKHAAVALAEWLACGYGHLGIGVSALCPMGVRTDFLMPGVEAGHPAARAITATAPIIEPEQVADAAVAGIAEGRFLILPHPEVGVLHARKAADPETWVAERRAAATARRGTGRRAQPTP
ncbi:SDR family oxidoreductase [Actinokineospora sp. PR83]|uniref:SDR family oxidoreductase n=1 Tax=Actinokineospora sp. PR83 TaxID=2884908 RepID=UPI001F219942|nr:SDR family oxidoreductase [Actinokineospora sp. PR83]MCG8918730.1 SDR family oxidoreductase [Actinokineospora sp. PR83]